MSELLVRLRLVARGHRTLWDEWVLAGCAFMLCGFVATAIGASAPDADWRLAGSAISAHLWALAIFLVAQFRPNWFD